MSAPVSTLTTVSADGWFSALVHLNLIAQNEDGILVCKYTEDSSCIPGTEFWLINKSPAKMSITAKGEGYVEYSMDYEHIGITLS
jgi:hypothetical protein